MNKEERDREKELKRLIYLKSELIREAKKELRQYKQELLNLGDNKGKARVKSRRNNNG